MDEQNQQPGGVGPTNPTPPAQGPMTESTPPMSTPPSVPTEGGQPTPPSAPANPMGEPTTGNTGGMTQ